MRCTIILLSLLSFLLISAIPAAAQEHAVDETSWEVKELWNFHETIYQLWHTAWPEKDTELLKDLLPDLEAGYESLVNVELPGILRDKKLKWDDNLNKLGTVVKDYKTAAANNEDQALLDAAEKIHTYFEMLVRTIRPVLKEVDDFHQVLYRLFHYDIIDYNYEKVKTSAADLKDKMDLLNKAELPERMIAKLEMFNKARAELSESVDNLYETVNSSDDKDAIIGAVDQMHVKYQALEKVFD